MGGRVSRQGPPDRGSTLSARVVIVSTACQTSPSERALDHAAVDAKRGAVDRGSQRAGHERDERTYFLGHREALDQRRGPYFLEELLFELREGLARGFRKRLDEIAD